MITRQRVKVVAGTPVFVPVHLSNKQGVVTDNGANAELTRYVQDGTNAGSTSVIDDSNWSLSNKNVYGLHELWIAGSAVLDSTSASEKVRFFLIHDNNNFYGQELECDYDQHSITSAMVQVTTAISNLVAQHASDSSSVADSLEKLMTVSEYNTEKTLTYDPQSGKLSSVTIKYSSDDQAPDFDNPDQEVTLLIERDPSTQQITKITTSETQS